VVVCERIDMEESLDRLEAGISGMARRFRAAVEGRKKIADLPGNPLANGSTAGSGCSELQPSSGSGGRKAR
jgi:hypothetical protein